MPTILNKLLLLAIDSLFTLCSYSSYLFFQTTVNQIKKAEELGINPNLDELTDGNKNVIIQGTVTPLTEDIIHSLLTEEIKGVVQRLTTTHHRIRRNALNCWSGCKDMVYEVVNYVPFGLKNESYIVKISDFENIYILDMNLIAHKCELQTGSPFEATIGYFSGVRRHFLEVSEEMLREGAKITGFGEITVVNGVKTLKSPSDGSAYILTFAHTSTLMKKLEIQQNLLRFVMIISGAIGIYLILSLMKDGIKCYQKISYYNKMRKILNDMRRERSLTNQNEELPEKPCIICFSEVCEVIIIPCGHLCLCLDCSTKIEMGCPLCRNPVEGKYVVFF